MSTRAECVVIQTHPDRWFYVLEDGNAPKNAFDWREYATAYGPFPDKDKARAHLLLNHANPGGFWTQSLKSGQTELDLSTDPLLRQLIDQATANSGRPTLSSRARRRW